MSLIPDTSAFALDPLFPLAASTLSCRSTAHNSGSSEGLLYNACQCLTALEYVSTEPHSTSLIAVAPAPPPPRPPP